ncbi:MAG: class I SAM-dependent methyltransferase [Candidatus Polarisedimenticolia bacterium]
MDGTVMDQAVTTAEPASARRPSETPRAEFEAAFWRAVDDAHARFLSGAIDQKSLWALLDPLHREAAGRAAADRGGVEAAGATAGRNTGPTPIAAAVERLRGGYDSVMYWPPLLEYYGGSDFVNFGFWDAATSDARQASENLMERLLAFIPDPRGLILDVACGKGATTRHLQRHYAPGAITGINISERQLETCRRNAPGSKFVKMDATALEFDDASFDAAICVEAAFHFNTRERFLREAARVLKPGGRLVLCDLLLTPEAEERRLGRYPANYVHDKDAYAALGRAAGFAEIQVIDASEECFNGAFRHLARYSHEKLLRGEMTPEGLRSFCGHIFTFVPDFRFYLLASFQKP